MSGGAALFALLKKWILVCPAGVSGRGGRTFASRHGSLGLVDSQMIMVSCPGASAAVVVRVVSALGSIGRRCGVCGRG